MSTMLLSESFSFTQLLLQFKETHLLEDKGLKSSVYLSQCIFFRVTLKCFFNS